MRCQIPDSGGSQPLPFTAGCGRRNWSGYSGRTSTRSVVICTFATRSRGLGGRYQLEGVESRSGARTVPLAAVAVEALAEERLAHRKARIAAGSNWRKPILDLVWTTTTRQPQSGSAITHRFADALPADGLPAMHWHHLRQAFAGLMPASGVELAVVSNLLGHSSVTLTSSIYAGAVRRSSARPSNDWEGCCKSPFDTLRRPVDNRWLPRLTSRRRPSGPETTAGCSRGTRRNPWPNAGDEWPSQRKGARGLSLWAAQLPVMRVINWFSRMAEMRAKAVVMANSEITGTSTGLHAR